MAQALPDRRRILEHLKTIEASKTFQNVSDPKKLLHFLVLNTLDGHADELKGTYIAQELFEGDDGAMRSGAGRLRTKLLEYYHVEGALDTIRIDIPKGSYIPTFFPVPPSSRPEQSASLLAGEPLRPSAPSVAAKLRTTNKTAVKHDGSVLPAMPIDHTAHLLSLTVYDVERLLHSLPPEVFPLVCLRYLVDSGMTCQTEPVQQFERNYYICGTTSAGKEYVAYCTTVKEKSFTANFISHTIAHGPHSSTREEVIYILYSKRVTTWDSVERMNLRDRIVSLLAAIDNRYADSPREIIIATGPEIASEIVRRQAAAYDFLFRLRKPHDPFMDWDHDSLGPPTVTREIFLRLISDYSDLLPRDRKLELLDVIVRCAWDLIVFDRVFASQLATRQPVNGRVGSLITAFCGVSLGRFAEPTAYADLWLILTSIRHEFPEIDAGVNRLGASLLRQMLYEQPECLDDPRILKLWNDLAARGESFWDDFILDSYLRSSCDFLVLSPQGHGMIAELAEDIIAKRPHDLLCRLAPFVTDPFQTFGAYSRADAISLLGGIARECTSALHARWTLQAFRRTVPLYDRTEEESGNSDDLELLRAFRGDLRRTAPGLQFAYLHGLLAAYARIKASHYLEEYERSFVSVRSKLLLPQISHLQLEYVSSLFRALQTDDPGFENLQWNLLFRNRRNPAAHPLLANQLLEHKLVGQPSLADDKKGRIRWLEDHALSLYRCYVSPYLTVNHLFALQVQMAAGIDSIRQQMSSVLQQSLKEISETAVAQRPSVCAKTVATFKLIPRSQSTEMMLPILERALQAGRYDVFRNARDIAHALYFCAYYSPLATSKARAKELMATLGRLTKVGTGSGRVHWAYYACVMYADRPKEREFANSMFESTIRKFTHLDTFRRSDLPTSATFSTAALSTIREFLKTSLFAAALQTSLTSPELWNTLGTTVMLHRDSDMDIDSLNMATHFYACARCFVRERKDLDIKYAFNWIRAACLRSLAKAEPLDQLTAGEIAIYVASPPAQVFAYKSTCSEAYFQAIRQSWNSFPNALRDSLVEKLSRREWTRKMLAGIGIAA